MTQSSTLLQLPRLQWWAVLIGVLAAWLAVHILVTWQEHAQRKQALLFSSSAAREWLPARQRVPQLAARERRFIASTEVDGASLTTTSPYFHILTHLYDLPASDDLIPEDEVAKFHELETGLPLSLAGITSNFGERKNPFGHGQVFHRGIDIAAPKGTPVQAVAEGKVITATNHPTYGNYVVIDHQNGYRTLYAHNSKLLVKRGARVKVGQNIAEVGSTGRSTGSHLHFEMHRDGAQVDPYPYLAVL